MIPVFYFFLFFLLSLLLLDMVFLWSCSPISSSRILGLAVGPTSSSVSLFCLIFVKERMVFLDRVLHCSPDFQTGLEVASYSVDWPQTISHSSAEASRVLERQAQPLCLASINCFHFHFLTEALLLQEWKRSRQRHLRGKNDVPLFPKSGLPGASQKEPHKFVKDMESRICYGLS